MDQKDYIKARRSTEDARLHFEKFQELRGKLASNPFLANTDYVAKNPFKTEAQLEENLQKIAHQSLII